MTFTALEANAQGGMPGGWSGGSGFGSGTTLAGWPKVAALASGGFVILSWYSDSSSPSAAGFPLRAQLYNDAGQPLGAPVQIASPKDNNLHNFSVAGLHGGGFVIVQSELVVRPGQEPGEDLFVQMFDAAGAATSAKAMVNTSTPGNQYLPEIAVLDDDRFVVVWHDQYGNWPAQTGGVKAQIFSPEGAKLGGEFLVPPKPVLTQTDPDVVALPGRGFLAVWQEDYTSPGVSAFRGQFFDTAGARLGATVNLHSWSSNAYAFSPEIIALRDGGFVLTWVETNGYNDERRTSSIQGQLLDRNGAAVGDVFEVSVDTQGDRHGPSAVALADGGFVVTWQDAIGDGSGSAILGRFYDAAGEAAGLPFVVDTPTSEDQRDPAAAVLPWGGFVVAWGDYGGDTPGNSSTLAARLFAPAGFAAKDDALSTDEASVRQGSVFADNGSGGDLAPAAGSPWIVAVNGSAASVGHQILLASGARLTLNADGTYLYDPSGAFDALAATGTGGSNTTAKDSFTYTLAGGGGTATVTVTVAGLWSAPHVIEGTGGDDVLTGTPLADTLHGGAGDDLLNGGLGADTLEGGDGDDRLVFSAVQVGGGIAAAIGTLDGGAGYDVLDLSGVAPVTVGTIEASPGVYALGVYVGSQRFAISGIEKILLGAAADFVGLPTHSGPTIEVRGGGGADDFFGTGDYALYGEEGDDSFFVSGRFGESSTSGLIDGGAGTNTLRTNIAFAVDLAAGTAVSGQASYAIANIQNVVATTHGYASTVDGDEADNMFSVQPFGDDGAAGVAFDGRGGDDVLTGSAGSDSLDGGAGDDLLDGRSGADAMAGGPGDDIYVLDDAGDSATEQADEGFDTVQTILGSRSDFAQLFHLPDHVESLVGTGTAGQGVWANGLDNVIAMGSGGDLVVTADSADFYAPAGDDTVSGGDGNDFLFFGGSFTNGDKVDGGSGFDTLGLLGTYSVTFDPDDLVGIEKLAGYSSGDAAHPNAYAFTTIDANVAAGARLMVIGLSLQAGEHLVFDGAAETDGSFNLRGGRDSDALTGGANSDQLYGGLGADALKGGGGIDYFEYYSAADSTASATDTILDFEAGDRISLVLIDADGQAGNGDQAFAFLGSAAFTGAAGQLRAEEDAGAPGHWTVEADIDGDGRADLVIAVTIGDGHALQAGDFFL
ncbi:MAG: hypothetical protein JOZ90_04250 [Alphaproteobacteria bacterium]|nr:hypothetical protein [Alphaproteobacteria bacterium]MBV9373204.1 hypothetical protein [Alphaproteobacteria bacterium]MBV9900293.1 hypothetical protein [Alphaproteobacteria bacterium]